MPCRSCGSVSVTGIDIAITFYSFSPLDIIMDGPPAQSLGVEPVDPGIMKKPPRSRGANILSSSLVSRVLTAAALVVFGTMFIYVSELEDGQVTNRDATMVMHGK